MENNYEEVYDAAYKSLILSFGNERHLFGLEAVAQAAQEDAVLAIRMRDNRLSALASMAGVEERNLANWITDAKAKDARIQELEEAANRLLAQAATDCQRITELEKLLERISDKTEIWLDAVGSKPDAKEYDDVLAIFESIEGYEKAMKKRQHAISPST